MVVPHIVETLFLQSFL